MMHLPSMLYKYLTPLCVSAIHVIYRYYNSFFDNANSTGPETYNDITPTVQHIQMIATTVARTVYSLLFGRTDIHNIHASNITVRRKTPV